MESFYSQVDDFTSLDAVYKVIQLWEDELIFAKSFAQLMKSYVKPKLDSAKQKLAQVGGPMHMNSRKVQEDRLKKQLKVLNSFPICKHAVQMDI